MVPIGGIPMLQRTLERLVPAPVVIVVDPRSPLPPSLAVAARVIPDTRPGEGPLAALEAGLLATDTRVVTVVAGDMPWVSPVVLRLLATRLEAEPTASIACVADEDGPRPLPLAARCDRALPLVTALLDSGERRLRALLRDAVVVPLAGWLPLDPDRGSLRDVDTTADLVAAR
jgi:molybdopterin-guanine dinucleotide biosynthesis protein A